MFCAELVVSSEKTNTYAMQERIRHHLFQVGHAHDVELGREREGQWEPVAVAALAVGGQGVAQGAPADAQAAVGDQDNLRGHVGHFQPHRTGHLNTHTLQENPCSHRVSSTELGKELLA